MKNRLACVASLIPDGRGVIDVGTDHGALPVALARRGYPGALFASDLRPGPLDAARRTAGEAGLEGRISFLLCDGLALCDPEAVDTIVIAGMGGDTVCGILDRAEWCMDARYLLVLQPMTRAEVLRYWLVNNGFAILTERLVREGDTVYTVLSARFGGCTLLSDAELYTGAFAQTEGQEAWPLFLRQQLRRFEKMLLGLRQGDRDEARLRLTEEIYNELKERSNDAHRTGDF